MFRFFKYWILNLKKNLNTILLRRGLQQEHGGCEIKFKVWKKTYFNNTKCGK